MFVPGFLRRPSAALLGLMLPASLLAQAPRLVWRGLIGETALEVRVSGTNVLVGAAGEAASVSAAFRGTDVRQFVDSLTRRLARARQRDTTWTLRVEEPGVSAGAMSLRPAGRDDRRRRLYSFFLADDIVAPVQQQMSLNEVNLLLRSLREASARPAPPRKAAPKRRPKPAPKSSRPI
jgi:hypothetical protein